MRPFLIALLCATHLALCPIPGEAEPFRDQRLLPDDELVEPTYTPVATPRGARPHKPFEVGEIDTIDTASGNLTIRIPLGQTYIVGPKLRYRFQVVHNSNAWDFVKADWTDNGVPGDRVLPLANPGSNAGLGWELHFGKLFAPLDQRPDGMAVYDVPRWPNRDGDPTDAADRWMYVAPDGGRHYLVDLPGRDNGTFSNPVRYTKSGTVLRLRKTDASTVLVEFPDGLVSEFRRTGDTAAGTDFCGGGVSGCWRLHETGDLYGNRVSFAYGVSGTVETWTVTDSTGRIHELAFSVSDADTGGGDGAPTSSTQEGDEPGDVRRVLEEVRLAAFDYRTTTVEAPAGENGKYRESVYYNAVHQGPQHPLGTEPYDAWQVTDTGLPYSNLALKSTRFEGFSHYEYRADIDENTGLESNVYDVSDLRTGLTFDRLGRLRHVSPEPALQGDFIEYVYSHLSNGDAKVDVFHRTDAASELKKETQIFDGFGRLISESRRKPVGAASFSPSIRRTAYDALGRKTKVSTWQASAGFDIDESWRYGDYDVFDRPRTITAPNGWVEQRAYQGIRRSTSMVQIRTSETGTSAVTRATVRDALGRVISESNPEHTTTQAYDPYDALVSSMRIGPGLAPAGQTRMYGLDARGYLLSEDLPEIDGIVTYKPDALGLPRRTFDGLNTLDHVFDGAGRLTEVKDLSGKRWKLLIYGQSNDGTNRRRGKLEHVLRVNEPVDGGEDLGIVETYEYRAALGKASRLTTKIYYPDRPRGSQFGAAFQQDFAYDRFGNVRSYSYPKCVVNGDGETPCDDGDDRRAPSHTVTTTFNQGIPRTVTSSLGPTATSSYHSNFQPSEMLYGNGVTGTFAEGPAHLPRPKRIAYSTASGGTLWDSGDFTFDGVGNIATLGDDLFTYDRASRLLSGTVRSAGPNRREELTFDAADNITSFARDGGAPVAHNVDAATNRLLGRRGDASILWDAAGSVTSIGRQSDGRPVFLMTIGPFRRQTSFEITDPDPGMPSRKWSYLYGPGDVRLMVEDHNGERRWTFRDPSDRIVREYIEIDDAWKHERDFIHGPSGLIATRRHNGMVRYFHADHLGTPRLYTASDGKVFSRKNYYPFGAEIEDASAVLLDGFEDGDTRFWLESKDERRVEWTGHERDPHGLTDYMLARTCLFPFYRFGSVDPGRDGWNLYSYARNNPVAYVDPDGRFTATAAQEVLGMMGEFKNSSMSALSDGSSLGVLLATGAGTGIDLASGFVEPFTLGAATGEAIGSGAGGGEVTLAILGDALRFVGLAAPVTGSLRAAGSRVILVPRGGAKSVISGVRLNRQLASQEIAGGHAFEKHIGEFLELGIDSRKQFAAHIESIMNQPSAVRSLRNGREAFWNEATGTIVIRNPRAADGGTAFRPKNGRAYFEGLN